MLKYIIVFKLNAERKHFERVFVFVLASHKAIILTTKPCFDARLVGVGDSAVGCLNPSPTFYRQNFHAF